MIVEIDINDDLFYLEQLLYTLDMFRFEEDILRLISELRSLVNKKLYSGLSHFGYEIESISTKQTYFLKKYKKSIDVML